MQLVERPGPCRSANPSSIKRAKSREAVSRVIPNSCSHRRLVNFSPAASKASIFFCRALSRASMAGVTMSRVSGTRMRSRFCAACSSDRIVPKGVSESSEAARRPKPVQWSPPPPGVFLRISTVPLTAFTFTLALPWPRLPFRLLPTGNSFFE